VIGWTNAIERVAGPADITLGIFGAIALLNIGAARSLKRKLDGLDALA
jgi:hypothetical protein